MELGSALFLSAPVDQGGLWVGFSTHKDLHRRDS
jgi:hypothetical protein